MNKFSRIALACIQAEADISRFAMIPRCLLILFLAGTLATLSSTARGTTVEQANYRGAVAYRLSDGKTEAIVVPEYSGRVMFYGQVDGRNWLWNAPPEKLGGEGFQNYGGDKTFVGPHSLWSTFTNSIWPPDPTWDGSAHEATVLPGGRLRTTGNVWRGFGVRVIREFGFDSGEFVVQQTIEKLAGEPRLLSIWQVAQIAPPDAVYLPMSANSAYRTGYHLFGVRPENAQIEALSPTLLRTRPTTGRGYKVGVDAPVAAIAAVRGNVALLLRAAKPKGHYPDGAEGAGFPVELYNHGDAGSGQYVELELLSPLRPFYRGTRWTHTVRWSLHDLPSSAQDNNTLAKTLEDLLYMKTAK